MLPKGRAGREAETGPAALPIPGARCGMHRAPQRERKQSGHPDGGVDRRLPASRLARIGFLHRAIEEFACRPASATSWERSADAGWGRLP